MKQIAHELNKHESAAFLRILADTYNEYDHRPVLSRLACVEFEDTRYLCATDGIIAIFLPAPSSLDVGDYEGVPYLVKCENNGLQKMLLGLFKMIKGHRQADSHEADNVIESHAFIKDDSAGKDHLCTDVLLAHVEDDKFVFDMEKPHTHTVNRELYEYACDAIGYFDKVRYAKPHEAIVFLNSGGRGLALIMPIRPGCQVEVVQGG